MAFQFFGILEPVLADSMSGTAVAKFVKYELEKFIY